VDARCEPQLRSADAADRRVQVVPEFSQIICHAVGEFTIGLSPHEFGGVELRRVGRKEMHVETRVRRDELAHDETPVNRTAIPQEVDGAAHVPEQMAQIGLDIQAGEVASATAKIQAQPSAFRRDRQPATRGDAVAAISMAHAGSLAARRPRFGAHWE
jgi:hypothetical protein